MGVPSLGSSPSQRQVEDRLDSWKEIAAYLKRDTKTVQRWEKREGMPVHRHVHDKIGSVYASRAELDAWARGRNLRVAEENGISIKSSADSGLQPVPAISSSSSLIKSKRVLLLTGVTAALTIAASLWLYRTERFWRNPLADARLQTVTDFDGLQEAAAVSRDGHFVAFLSDHDGQMDVWVTQVGSGQFHNLTNGSAFDLANSSIRTLGFSPDGSLVTFWARKQENLNGTTISVWGVPTLGGQPTPYLEGVAEFDWLPDVSKLVYHTPAPGDPMFVSDGGLRSSARPIFTASAGLHAHFPLWSSDKKFVYFVQGSLPDRLDIWRVRSDGGTPERITSHNGRVTYPVLMNQHTLVYLASDTDGAGPWLYSVDVERRIPHRLTSEFEEYTSLAVSANGRRLVATRATPYRTLWRMRFADSLAEVSQADQIPLRTSAGSSPRLGANYLLYVSATGTGEGIWRLANGNSTELWRGEGARVFGGPSISRDGRYVTFAVQEHGRRLLYLMQADGMNARVVADSLELQGNPAWSPDGSYITTAAFDRGAPHLFRVPIDGRRPAIFVKEYSVDPSWSPDGRFIIYSGPDIGTTFSVKAVTAEVSPHPLPGLTLTRGARRAVFLPSGRELVLLRGDVEHKNLWLFDLRTGAERQLTNFRPEFNIQDFDISQDGREVVIERVQERSNVVLLDLPRP